MFKFNEMWQQAGFKAFEAVVCAMPQLMHDSARPFTQLTWDPHDFTHHCNCVNQSLGASLAPNYLLVMDTHFEEKAQFTLHPPTFASQHSNHSGTLYGQEQSMPHSRSSFSGRRHATRQVRATCSEYSKYYATSELPSTVRFNLEFSPPTSCLSKVVPH